MSPRFSPARLSRALSSKAQSSQARQFNSSLVFAATLFGAAVSVAPVAHASIFSASIFNKATAPLQDKTADTRHSPIQDNSQTANHANDHAITFTWNSSRNATHYELEKFNGSSWELVEMVATTQATVSGLGNGEHQFRVRD